MSSSQQTASATNTGLDWEFSNEKIVVLCWRTSDSQMKPSKSIKPSGLVHIVIICGPCIEPCTTPQSKRVDWTQNFVDLCELREFRVQVKFEATQSGTRQADTLINKSFLNSLELGKGNVL